jgi:hypothetical protein
MKPEAGTAVMGNAPSPVTTPADPGEAAAEEGAPKPRARSAMRSD